MNQEGSKEKLLSDFKVLVDDTEALLKATANQAGERISAARHCIEQSLETSKKTLAAAQETVIGKTQGVAEAADGCVRKNPWRAVGIAAGVGLLLGLLLRRG